MGTHNQSECREEVYVSAKTQWSIYITRHIRYRDCRGRDKKMVTSPRSEVKEDQSEAVLSGWLNYCIHEHTVAMLPIQDQTSQHHSREYQGAQALP